MPRPRYSPALAILVFSLLLASPPAHAEGVDPSLALWGSSAVALLFTLGGSLALAWYHRAQGALDGRLIELRDRATAQEGRLSETREEYVRKADIERFNTLEATLRRDLDEAQRALRAELRGEVSELRSEVRQLHAELGSIRSDMTKILNILSTGAR